MCTRKKRSKIQVDKFKYDGRTDRGVPRAAVRSSGSSLLRCVTDKIRQASNIALHLSRMVNALHRSQTRLWRSRNQSLLTAVIGTRWMSNLSSLSDIEVPSIFSPYIVLMSVPEHSMEG